MVLPIPADFIDVFLPVGQVFQVSIDSLFHQGCIPTLGFHLLEEVLQLCLVSVGITAPPAQGVFRRQGIQHFAEQLHPLQVAQGFQLLPPKAFQVVLYDAIAKGVKGVDRDPVRFRANKPQQAFAHRIHPCISKGQAKDVVRLCVRLHKNTANTGR